MYLINDIRKLICYLCADNYPRDNANEHIQDHFLVPLKCYAPDELVNIILDIQDKAYEEGKEYEARTCDWCCNKDCTCFE